MITVRQVDLAFTSGTSTEDDVIRSIEGLYIPAAPAPLATHVGVLFLVEDDRDKARGPQWIGVEAVPPVVRVLYPSALDHITHRRYVAVTDAEDSGKVMGEKMHTYAFNALGEGYSYGALAASATYILADRIERLFGTGLLQRADCSMLATQILIAGGLTPCDGLFPSMVFPSRLEAWCVALGWQLTP